jgi:hypothetical protein
MIICDIDGTISDAGHRIEHAQLGDWDTFHSLAHLDGPIHSTIGALHSFYPHYDITLMTGRPEKYRSITDSWLIDHGLHYIVDEIIMRPDSDFRPDGELKISLLEDRFGSKDQVLQEVTLVLEDRDRVVEAMRDYGLTVWQVRQGDY